MNIIVVYFLREEIETSEILNKCALIALNDINITRCSLKHYLKALL